MNDLGWTLVWLAVQVAIVLVPAIGLLALATRRGPVPAAWVATLSLAMVVALGVLAFLPGLGSLVETTESLAPVPPLKSPAEVTKVYSLGANAVAEPDQPEAKRGRAFARFRLAWGRFERRAAEPIARFRPWSRALALVCAAGSAVGLVRLMVGLWAIGLCRRRGRLIDDAGIVRLVEELRKAMGCGPNIELREVPELTTPATAGWFQPMLLLPGNWREWSEPDRRAVVAHELAHVIRGDYAAGLLARVAVVLNYYHPLVRWMAGRLHLEQELAADAMGARFAGGRSRYLLALSRLALEQDGRPSSWPARAFLPPRGTLIRRIAMLKDESESKWNGQAWSKAMRLVTALGLLALTFGVASFKAPARAQEYKLGSIEVHGEARQRAPGDPASVRPFETRYLPDTMTGAVAFRPASIARRVGIDVLNPLIRTFLGGDQRMLAKQLGVDMSRPGFVKLGVEGIESITSGFTLGEAKTSPGKKEPDDKKMHSLMFSGLTVRMTAPFDLPGFCRQWTMDLEEVREGRGVYYKVKDPAKAEILMGCVLYQPDNRTVVFESEARVKELIAREVPSCPAYLRGADWDRACGGLLAVALNNQGDSFTKGYDLGRPDDKVVLQLMTGIDRWMLGVPDTDEISLIGEATARDPKSAESVARSIEALVKLGSAALDALMAEKEDFPKTGVKADAFRMYKNFLAKLKPRVEASLVSIQDEGFGTIANLVAIIKMELAEARPEPEAEEAKANAKAEKR